MNNNILYINIKHYTFMIIHKNSGNKNNNK